MSERGETIELLKGDELELVTGAERCPDCEHLDIFHNDGCLICPCPKDLLDIAPMVH